MTSNFEFLTKDPDTQILYDTAKNAENLYAMGMFSNEFESIRKVMEHVARQILDFNYVQMDNRSSFNDCLRKIQSEQLVSPQILNDFYSLKGNGNKAAHTLGKYSKGESLDGLMKMHGILVWYANSYMDDNQDINNFVEPKKEKLYQTAERKLIYVQTADNNDGQWPAYSGLEKIGDASIDSYEMNNRPNSDDLRQVADKRIRQYMGTAGVPYKLQWAELAYRKKDKRWFRDYDVHEVLLRSGIKKKERGEGQEWFETDIDTAKKAIQAVKDGRKSIDNSESSDKAIKIILRPEQTDAVKKTEKAFKHNDKMLWNAKMRFGKTLSALQLIKKQGYQHVLIMTHRPVVDAGWFDDFKKIGMPEAGYIYGSKNEGENFDYLAKSEKPFVYFASLQDLRGSEVAGGSAGDKNRSLFKTMWDLVIIDEAHEGTQTDLAKRVTDLVVKEDHTKLLELSGTPFNILDQYDEDQVYTWDYVMEQKAKANWDNEHPDEPNPYDGLPKVSMYTFEMNKNFQNSTFNDSGKQSFNFKEFFRVNEDGKFVYEDKVNQFLTNITSPDRRTNYPFSTKEFRNQLRHTLWILPGIKAANALEKLMSKHPVFGLEYNIVNVVRDMTSDKDNGITLESDIKKVEAAIGEDAAKTKTITLTVRKMTTGVTIKPWTGVLFLSNTNSAMQYLQAAFRAQTPYSSPTFGKKTNCYIFDFAPDRALTVMAASTQLNTGVGKRMSGAQKDKMSELMNFLPIIGESNQGMKPFKVDTLLAKIKRVYAEKAVRTGFDDTSLYNDELLMLQDVDLKAFNDLKAIVGTTKADKKPMRIDVNNQGLTDEEYDNANNGEKKPKRKRTPDEEAAMDKMKELKKQRKTMISILRSISIRIPMMIYGMDVDLSEDITVRKFVNKVDEKSWQEFMPKGVTKALFLEFSKYYDQDVFIEAGKIIRQQVKRLDKLDLTERTEQLAGIFGTFRNPDKETVLTPWRVVNMQLGKTLGGLSFYDDNYQYTTTNGSSATHWIRSNYTNKIFNRESHILEINSKTGLYPLYAAMSLYWLEYQKLINDKAGKFGLEDELIIWQRILRENIFVIAKTPMAAAITRRTLAGYHDTELNIEYVDNIIEDTKTNVGNEARKIGRMFGNMKFDVVIGNPPYQDETHGDNDRYAPPVYHYFMDLSYQLADVVALITPARFLFRAGSTPKDWTDKMLQDKNLSVVDYESDSSHVFPHTDIKGGIAITLHDKSKQIKSISEIYAPAGIYIPFPELSEIMKKVVFNNFESFSDVIYSRTAYKLTQKMHDDNPEALSKLSKGHPYDLASNIFNRLPDIFFNEEPNDSYEYIYIVGRENNKRVGKYIRKDYVQNKNNLNKYKVFVTQANGTGMLGESLSSPFVAKPDTGATETYISIGAFESIKSAENVLKYIKTKFVRVMLGILKTTQNGNKDVWRLVPMQDFSVEKDINWSESVANIDKQLYKKYNLSSKEIKFIEEKVQAMK
ncbi:Eco57I restriction-modification methylase domain-containing protein [Lactiplantibacillus paraplantarum]|uniref:Eco57I restriction-modification methylase domain-containing protein n=1 Tax=Lactiplantibacillus paraplantarum TaxID=60520 RepID=UPI000E09BF5C|nr:Eco57I restriction-modification methylase domain-containing protein [Lactiplantibacillus paraplantarum]MCW1908912.1 Eco57I restriction-modification methylase domain-containing protein [Lactiplantibacillus paraplantarum]RDG11885.1 restriction endonuclease [Lactiplantibacillus paraplantarum]